MVGVGVGVVAQVARPDGATHRPVLTVPHDLG